MSERKISRRTIAAGAAWALPAVAAASAVPAFASSSTLVRGINGWLTYERRAARVGGWPSTHRECRYYYDGTTTGVGDDGLPRGLFVWPAENDSAITSAPTITFHLPQEVTWKNDNPNSGWSLPVYQGQDADGLHKYTTTYSGGYRTAQGREPGQIRDPQTGEYHPALYIVGRPKFTGSATSNCVQDSRQAVTRCVELSGETVCHIRRKRFGGSYWSSGQRSAL